MTPLSPYYFLLTPLTCHNFLLTPLTSNYFLLTSLSPYYFLLTPLTSLLPVNPADLTSCRTREVRHQRVKTWTRHVDIFTKDFLFVPVNQE